MKDVFKHYRKYLTVAKKQAAFTVKNFSLDLMREKFKEILDKYIPLRTEEVKLTLPKLNMNMKKLGLSTPAANEIKLPKLKKIE